MLGTGAPNVIWGSSLEKLSTSSKSGLWGKAYACKSDEKSHGLIRYKSKNIGKKKLKKEIETMLGL